MSVPQKHLSVHLFRSYHAHIMTNEADIYSSSKYKDRAKV